MEPARAWRGQCEGELQVVAPRTSQLAALERQGEAVGQAGREAAMSVEDAHQKAMQAARKLSNDLTELKMLRMEREDTQRLKQGKATPEDPTMKRLSEMEKALRKASGQVDRANAAVRRLETENAEIRAEMEASKLSTSEFIEVAKPIELIVRDVETLTDLKS
ncbi:hypothetical protein RJ640_014203 [Escallonia rubra]|uniref:Uncharacterized protein n=1 Tax=Escallonia rubra TaxID=112253 RepID=A0AA88RG56_9ASTE|nr:hypothetical protein RJ640_014203 [Escallonia rubra]